MFEGQSYNISDFKRSHFVFNLVRNGIGYGNVSRTHNIVIRKRKRQKEKQLSTQYYKEN